MIDTVESWPDGLADLVADVAAGLPEVTDSVLDLPVNEWDAQRIAEAAVGTHWRLYHCTRLLPHEREVLLADGLHPASEGLLDRKLGDAVTHGYLTDGEAEVLRESHMLRADRGQRAREGHVCALTTRESLRDLHGLRWLFGHWGGELIYFDQPEEQLTRLKSLGAPAIVVVDLPLVAPPNRYWYPPFANLLVGRVLGLPEVRGETNQAVLGAWPVSEVWQPGDPEYDAQGWLPVE